MLTTTWRNTSVTAPHWIQQMVGLYKRVGGTIWWTEARDTTLWSVCIRAISSSSTYCSDSRSESIMLVERMPEPGEQLRVRPTDRTGGTRVRIGTLRKSVTPKVGKHFVERMRKLPGVFFPPNFFYIISLIKSSLDSSPIIYLDKCNLVFQWVRPISAGLRNQIVTACTANQLEHIIEQKKKLIKNEICTTN